MARKVRKRRRQTGAWDTNVQLTEKEAAIMKRAIKKVVRSIFARENRRLQRRILLTSLSDRGYDTWFTAVDEAHLENERKRKKQCTRS